jgi:hypothetical protein
MKTEVDICGTTVAAPTEAGPKRTRMREPNNMHLPRTPTTRARASTEVERTQCKRRYEETADWVKLESEASSEPPRHQRRPPAEAKCHASPHCRSSAASRGRRPACSAEAKRVRERDPTHPRMRRPQPTASHRKRSSSASEEEDELPKSVSRSQPHRSAGDERSPRRPRRVMQRVSASRNATMGLLQEQRRRNAHRSPR